MAMSGQPIGNGTLGRWKNTIASSPACSNDCTGGVMPPEAVLDTLRHLWRNLEQLELSAALMGGLALSYWRHPRFTKDVDVLVALDPSGLENVLNHLRTAGFHSKGTDPVVRLSDVEIIQLLYEPPDAYLDVQVDLLAACDEYQRHALERRIRLPSSELGFEVQILACEDLIVHKLLAGRMIDLLDAGVLLRENRATIDVDYLMRWVREKKLLDDFVRVWKEALPGERLNV
jgi:hypothetical protein